MFANKLKPTFQAYNDCGHVAFIQGAKTVARAYFQKALRLQETLMASLDTKMKEAQEQHHSENSDQALQQTFKYFQNEFKLASIHRPRSQAPPMPCSPLLPRSFGDRTLRKRGPPTLASSINRWWPFPNLVTRAKSSHFPQAVAKLETARDYAYEAYRGAVEVEKQSLDGGMRFRCMDASIHLRKRYTLDIANTQLNLGDVAFAHGATLPVHNAQRSVYLSQSNSHYESALAIKQLFLGTGHLELAWIFDKLAAVQCEQLSYEGASRRYCQALVLLVVHLGDRHSEVSRIYTRLGECAHNQSQYALAKGFYCRALSVQDRGVYRVHEVPKIYTWGLGKLALDLGDLAEARAMYAKALDIAVTGYDLRLISSIWAKLTSVAMKQCAYEDAVVLFQREADAVGNKRSGKVKRETIDRKFAEAEVTYRKFGDIATAGPILQECLGVYTENTNNISLAMAASAALSLADIALGEGANTDARHYYIQALNIREAAFGSDDLCVVAPYFGLARVAHNEGQWDDAVRFLRRSLNISEVQLGRDHVDCSTLHIQIGAVLEELSKQDEAKLQEARWHYEEAISFLKDASRCEELILADGYIRLGSVLMMKGSLEDVRSAFARAVHIKNCVQGNKHPDVLKVSQHSDLLYANAYQKKEFNDVEGSKSLLYAAMRGFNGSLKFAKACSALADITYDEGMSLKKGAAAVLDESRRLYHRLLEIKRSQETREHQFEFARVQRRLGFIAEKLGNYEEAEKCFEAELDIYRGLEVRDGLVESLLALGHIAVLLNKIPNAQSRLQNALKLTDEAPDGRTAKRLYARARIAAKIARLQVDAS